MNKSTFWRRLITKCSLATVNKTRKRKKSYLSWERDAYRDYLNDKIMFFIFPLPFPSLLLSFPLFFSPIFPLSSSPSVLLTLPVFPLLAFFFFIVFETCLGIVQTCWTSRLFPKCWYYMCNLYVWCPFLLSFVILVTGPKVLFMLGKYSTIELYLLPP